MKLIYPSIVITLVVIPLVAAGQESTPVRIGESFAKDARYHVRCRVEIAGTLTIPGNAKAAPKQVSVTGKSTIRYDERILRLGADGRADRTVRHYRQLEFERKVGAEEQQSKLRPQVARLVIMRNKQYEMAFSPSGPLTWGEVELVRTDVFGPALAGLLPTKAVRPGDRWQADNIAIQELTDLEKIDEATFTCTFEKITTLLGRRNAHIQFEGKVRGVGEDGSALHELRGSCYVDIDAGFLTYVYVKGAHHLLDKAGKATGKIEGTFVMTRSRETQGSEVDDNALRGLTLEPNAENMLLLFEHPQVAARFLYPRNWRIAGATDKQIGIDEDRGSGVLITLSPAVSTPTGAQFYRETAQFLTQQKAKFLRANQPKALASGLETFGFDVEIGKDRVAMKYYTMTQGKRGATVTARILPANLESVQRDVEKMARSLRIR